ncbi:DUF2804 domain-containing protein [Leptospira ryugenii]|uniref:DUF2804 domain-containing protein n=1 Tax=Leptospira ryugenii TaxID=1917863 RepID=UPI001FCE9803|nr:DUF2804 domain-containing protein [Leptospira ryugenii]
MPLLQSDGTLNQDGWARSPLWIYNRSQIAAGKWRIKEWDYYSVLSSDQKFGITITLADLGYVGLAAICFLDFDKRDFIQEETMTILPMGSTGFSLNSYEGNLNFEDSKIKLSMQVNGKERKLRFSAPMMKHFSGETGLHGEIILNESIGPHESMNIATSWKENRKAFYYNTKINCLSAKGAFAFGNKTYTFHPETDFGGLDWGRGVWTYKNRWYWSSASGLLEGKRFGFNLGYGFSDRSKVSENVLFYEGKVHKLDEITFHMNTQNYYAPWKFTSNDQRLKLDFTPIVDRNSKLDLFLIKSIQHQVFGKFTGTVVLDNGKSLQLNQFLGFAEDVLNWW